MSSPNLLEYHLLSRRPFYGLLSKGFHYFSEVSTCPAVPALRLIFSQFHSALLKRWCAMLIRGFRYPLVHYFQLWGVALFQLKVHRAAAFHPGTITILSSFTVNCCYYCQLLLRFLGWQKFISR